MPRQKASQYIGPPSLPKKAPLELLSVLDAKGNVVRPVSLIPDLARVQRALENRAHGSRPRLQY